MESVKFQELTPKTGGPHKDLNLLPSKKAVAKEREKLRTLCKPLIKVVGSAGFGKSARPMRSTGVVVYN